MINPLKALKKFFSIEPIKMPGECIAESIARQNNAIIDAEIEKYKKLADYYWKCSDVYLDSNPTLAEHSFDQYMLCEKQIELLKDKKMTLVVNGEIRVKGEENVKCGQT